MIPIGKIVNTRGLKGELVVLSYTSPVEHFSSYRQYFWKENFRMIPLEIEKQSPYKGDRIVIQVKGVSSIQEAQACREREIFISSEELPSLEEDEFFFHEALEAQVFVGEKYIGRVRSVQNLGSCDLLEVEWEEKEKRVFLPVLNDYLENFDIKNKKIVYQDIDDLL